jgi:hypothetical protein
MHHVQKEILVSVFHISLAPASGANDRQDKVVVFLKHSERRSDVILVLLSAFAANLLHVSSQQHLLACDRRPTRIHGHQGPSEPT